jgi:hypothetical protein
MPYGATGTTDTGSPPSCRAYHNAVQSIAHDLDTLVVFNSERWKTVAGMHSTSTNTSRITITDAGLYLLVFSGELVSANDYGQVYCYFRWNGSTPVGVGNTGSKSLGASGFEINGTAVWKFAANDYVEVLVRQTNTAAAARNMTSSANYSPEFSATWLGLGT